MHSKLTCTPLNVNSKTYRDQQSIHVCRNLMRFVKSLFIAAATRGFTLDVNHCWKHCRSCSIKYISSGDQLRVCLLPAEVSLPNAEPYVVVAGA